MSKVGVILSGCGVFDGSEIHEATLLLLCLDQQGAEYQCIAPSKPLDVVDHRRQQPSGEKRDVLEESARIARGNVVDLADVDVNDYDAFVLPGGFGAAKNLCTFASEGADCSVDPQVEQVLKEAHAAGKPIGLACIAPAVGARVFGNSPSVKLTIGHDAETAKQLEALGARHEECDVDETVFDAENRIVSTPAYMEAKSIKELLPGLEKLVAKVLELVNQPASV